MVKLDRVKARKKRSNRRKFFGESTYNKTTTTWNTSFCGCHTQPIYLSSETVTPRGTPSTPMKLNIFWQTNKQLRYQKCCGELLSFMKNLALQLTLACDSEDCDHEKEFYLRYLHKNGLSNEIYQERMCLDWEAFKDDEFSKTDDFQNTHQSSKDFDVVAKKKPKQEVNWNVWATSRNASIAVSKIWRKR